MAILALDHIQLAMPAGGEPRARSFYRDVLGFDEVQKPANLAVRGGVWFAVGAVKVHLGVDQDFAPARKAHPGFLVDNLRELSRRLNAAGFVAGADEPLAGYDRLYVSDPFGNRIELLEQTAALPSPTRG